MIEFPITLTSGGSVCLPGHAYALALGYTKNRGVYRLAVTASGEWEGLTIRAFWHVPDGKEPASSLVEDGYVAVPASVTAQPGSGCITFEGSDGAKVMTSADLRYRVSANSGTEDGTEPEPGTPAWQQLVDAVHADATAAEQAKTDAQTAAQQSEASAKKAGKALSDTITAKEDALKAIGDKQSTATPDVPVPIVSAGDGGSLTVKVTGKNLLHLTDGSKTFRGVTIAAKDGLISISGTATETGYAVLDISPFITPGVLILSSSIKSPVAALVSQTWDGILFQNAAAKMSDTATRLVFTVDQGQTYNLTNVKLQLELGTTATAYSPYREQLLTLPTHNGLPGIPVTSGGNYTDSAGQQWVCDEVDLTRGVRVQRVNAVDLSTCKITGTTELAVTKRLSIMLPIRGRDYKTEALCNKLQFLVSFSNDTPHFYVDTSNAQVFIPIGAKNPEEGEYILLYVLDAPIETPLTPAEIAAYKALTAYGPDTVVQASDGAGVKLEYQRDVNLVVKNLEDAIASMT